MSVYIIAEAGVNHNGDINTAKRLVDAAVDAGADAVKFQMFKADRLTTSNAKMAEYQKRNANGDSQRNMLRKLELSDNDHLVLQKYCEEKGIDFLSSPFDVESMQFLLSIGMDIIKIPSGEITNFPYLREAARSGKRIILSTGMCTMNEVKEAMTVIKKYSPDIPDEGDMETVLTQNDDGIADQRILQKITILHCNTQYPTPYDDVNLKAMLTLKDEFGCSVGYSDHTMGIEVPIAAVAMGATVIEKHFTLDRNMEGPDHKASLESNELKAMVASIRHIESALGDGIKHVTESEMDNIAVARKSIVAAIDIKKGDVFTEDNLTTKRPGGGISPMRWNEIIGRVADRDFPVDEKVTIDSLSPLEE